MPLPNFFIAGAGKSGTTKLWAILRQHPDVYFPKEKEPIFFATYPSEPRSAMLGLTSFWGRPLVGGNYKLGLDWYLQLFEDWNQQARIGEASGFYFFDPSSAELLSRHVPDAKLIFILRDPVDRVYSQYWQEKKWGLSEKNCPSFSEMVQTGHPRLDFCCEVSHYKMHIERFMHFFPRHQMLFLTSDDLKHKTNATIETVCQFLELDPNKIPTTQVAYHSSHKVSPFPAIERLKYTFLHSTTLFQRLTPTTKERLLSLKKTLFRITGLAPKEQTYTPLDANLRAQLIPQFLEDIAYVEALTGQDLSSWKRL